MIKKAYNEDVARDSNTKRLYREAFRVLNPGDHYILVMVAPALGLRVQVEATLTALLRPVSRV